MPSGRARTASEPSSSSIADWAAGHGYNGIQIPSWEAGLFDLAKAADWGYAGFELFCWGDHFEVQRALDRKSVV